MAQERLAPDQMRLRISTSDLSLIVGLREVLAITLSRPATSISDMTVALAELKASCLGLPSDAEEPFAWIEDPSTCRPKAIATVRLAVSLAELMDESGVVDISCRREPSIASSRVAKLACTDGNARRGLAEAARRFAPRLISYGDETMLVVPTATGLFLSVRPIGRMGPSYMPTKTIAWADAPGGRRQASGSSLHHDASELDFARLLEMAPSLPLLGPKVRSKGYATPLDATIEALPAIGAIVDSYVGSSNRTAGLALSRARAWTQAAFRSFLLGPEQGAVGRALSTRSWRGHDPLLPTLAAAVAGASRPERVHQAFVRSPLLAEIGALTGQENIGAMVRMLDEGAPLIETTRALLEGVGLGHVCQAAVRTLTFARNVESLPVSALTLDGALGGKRAHRTLDQDETDALTNACERIFAAWHYSGRRAPTKGEVARVAAGLLDVRHRYVTPDEVFWDMLLWMRARLEDAGLKGIALNSAVVEIAFPVGRKRKSLHRAARRWHDEQRRSAVTRSVGEGPKFKLVDMPSIMATQIRTAEGLLEEARAMRHCIDTYADEVISGVTAVLALQSEHGRSTAYFEIALEDDRYRLLPTEVLSAENTPPPDFHIAYADLVGTHWQRGAEAEAIVQECRVSRAKAKARSAVGTMALQVAKADAAFEDLRTYLPATLRSVDRRDFVKAAAVNAVKRLERSSDDGGKYDICDLQAIVSSPHALDETMLGFLEDC